MQSFGHFDKFEALAVNLFGVERREKTRPALLQVKPQLGVSREEEGARVPATTF